MITIKEPSYIEAFAEFDYVSRQVFGEIPGLTPDEPSRVNAPQEVQAAFRDLHALMGNAPESQHAKFLVDASEVLREHTAADQEGIIEGLATVGLRHLHLNSLIPTVTHPNDKEAMKLRQAIYDKKKKD